MIDLHERLQELADAAARDGITPGPAHAIRRGRRRRHRLAGGIASVLAVTLAVGVAGTAGRVPDRTPTMPPPAAPPVTSPPPQVAAPSPLPDGVRTSKPRPGSAEARALGGLAGELRRCPGGESVRADLIAYLWSREYRHLWMLAAKQPPAPKRLCWTSGVFDTKGVGSLWGARRIRSPGALLTHTGGIYPGFALIEGRVTKRAARVRLRFRDGRPPMNLVIVRAGDRYPTNFYVGFFRQGPMRPGQGGWAAATLTALDAAGRTITACRVGPPGDGTPKCYTS